MKDVKMISYLKNQIELSKTQIKSFKKQGFSEDWLRDYYRSLDMLEYRLQQELNRK